MKKGLSILLVLAIVLSCVSMITLFSQTTATALTYKEVVNGDAEDGTTDGWTKFSSGGVIENVTPGANNTEHAMRYSDASTAYGSIGFDLGPAIVQDEEAAYNGAGAGWYFVSFYAKAEEGKSGTFTFTLNSMNHQGKEVMVGSYKTTSATYISTGLPVVMTDEWQLFTVKVQVSQAFLTNLKNVYDAATGSAKTNTYQLILRLDGSKNEYNTGDLFAYYVDEVTIEKAVGAELTYNGAKYAITPNTGGAFSEKDVADSKITKTYTIYNPNETTLNVKVCIQTTHNSSWTGFDSKETALPAGQKVDLTVTAPVNGDGTITVGGSNYAVSKFFLRVNCEDPNMSNKIPASGTKLIVAAEPADMGAVSDLKNNSLVSNAPVQELPEFTSINTPTPTPEPITDKALVNGDVEDGTTNGWLKFSSGGALTVVTPGANNTEHAMRYSDAATAYGSIGYDLGPAIISDEDAGYHGAGAGKYTVTFYAKAEQGKGGYFKFVLNSMLHKAKDNVVNNYTLTSATYASYSLIEMTDSWQKFTVTFNVTEGFLTNLTNLYNAATGTDKSNTYKLILRLDGAKKLDDEQNARAYEGGDYFAYYVDEVTIEKNTDSNTPTPTPVVVNEKVGSKLTFNGVKYAITDKNGGDFSAADVTDNKLSKTYTVYNTSSATVKVKMAFHTVHTKGGTTTWAGFESKEVLIPVGYKADFTVEAPVNGDGTITFDGVNYEIGKFFLRVNCEAEEGGAAADGTALIVAPAAEEDLVAVAKLKGTKVVNEDVFELPEYPSVSSGTVDPDPEPDPEPATDKEVINGDAEDGTTNGWAKFSNGTVTSVTPGANNTDHAIKYSGASTEFGSIGFDLGPAIIQDEAAGYHGGGAGTYTVRFYAKAEEGKGGVFKFFLNSQVHKNKGQTIGDYTLTSATYAAYSLIELTDQWTEYAVTFKVSQAYLTNLYNAYAAGSNAEKAKLYQLVLRLDGSKKGAEEAKERAYEGGDYFAYYLDEVTIEQEEAITPNPSTGGDETPSVTYKEVVNGNAESGKDGWGVFNANGTIAISEPGANGTAHAMQYSGATSKYGSIAFDLGPAIVIDKEAGYDGAGAGTYTIEFYAKAEKGKGGLFAVVLNSQFHQAAGVKVGDYTLTERTYITGAGTITLTDQWQKFTISFKVTDSFLQNLVNAYHADPVKAAKAYQLILRLDGSGKEKDTQRAYDNGNFFAYYVDEVSLTTPEKPVEGQVVKKPGGVRFTVIKDLEKKASYMLTKTGVLTADDVKNGEITKTFRVYNEGSEDIEIEFSLQTTAKKSDGTNTWAGPEAAEKVLIEAGSSEEISYTMDVENGKVEVLGEMYPIEKFFMRINVTGADSGQEMEAGTINFVIAANGRDNDFWNEVSINGAVKAGWKVETVMTAEGRLYGTGDVLPVAIIAVLGAAIVALAVVVIRKKKEQ